MATIDERPACREFSRREMRKPDALGIPICAGLFGIRELKNEDFTRRFIASSLPRRP